MNLNEPENITDDTNLNIPESSYDLPLRIEDFPSNKDMMKFIKNVEKLVRSSLEYNLWVKHLRDALGHTTCEITNENISECKIDIHHHPIDLFTICKAVIYDKFNRSAKFCTFDIATEIIELHFKDKVGYIPLLTSMHEKYHNGYLKIPIDKVRGNFDYILANYALDDEELDKITELKLITTNNTQESAWKKDKYPGMLSTEKEQQLEIKSGLNMTPELKI